MHKTTWLTADWLKHKVRLEFIGNGYVINEMSNCVLREFFLLETLPNVQEGKVNDKAWVGAKV